MASLPVFVIWAEVFGKLRHALEQRAASEAARDMQNRIE